ncbi:MAG: hypothetical protein R3261_15310, partial [Alphaproteobacteria bacterium]|nr:hypothetical protein [Alphaproteobacteria bacterium]
VILCATFAKKPFKLVPSWASKLSVSPIYALWPATIRFRTLFGGGKFRDFITMALEAIKTVEPSVISARVKAILQVNVLNSLQKISVPVLYMASLKDHLIKKHNISTMKAIKPAMEVTEINTQHFILQLEPELSAKIITDFIKKIREPSNKAL